MLVLGHRGKDFLFGNGSSGAKLRSCLGEIYCDDNQIKRIIGMRAIIEYATALPSTTR